MGMVNLEWKIVTTFPSTQKREKQSCQHYRHSRGVARATIDRTNSGSLKLGSMLSFHIEVIKKIAASI